MGTQVLEIPFIYRTLEKLGGVPLNLTPMELVPTVGRGKYTPKRDLFAECVPILRGESAAVEDIDASNIDGLIIPGGRGAITVLSDVADSGSDARVVRAVKDLIVGMHVRNKPIGSIGYGGALVLISLKHSAEEPIVVLGEDAILISELSSLGIAPVKVGSQEVVFDQDNVLFSTSGINQECSIVKGADGVERLTGAVIEYCKKKRKKEITQVRLKDASLDG